MFLLSALDNPYSLCESIYLFKMLHANKLRKAVALLYTWLLSCYSPLVNKAKGCLCNFKAYYHGSVVSGRLAAQLGKIESSNPPSLI